MLGPQILARSLSNYHVTDTYKNRWQYHSRSDSHSKIACWCVLLDLVRESSVLRRHFTQGLIGFGVNHELRDFKVNRKKKLDLVIATQGPEVDARKTGRSLRDLASGYEIALAGEDLKALDELPPINEASVGSVRVALEAKACMTAHSKAIPRLHDELNSSHQTVHGAAEEAVAVGFVMVNSAGKFVSPDMNKQSLTGQAPKYSLHKQPRDAVKVLKSLEKLPRRTKLGEVGYDAFGALVVELQNDGSEVRVVEAPVGPSPGEIFYYGQMIRKAAARYNAQFGGS